MGLQPAWEALPTMPSTSRAIAWRAFREALWLQARVYYRSVHPDCPGGNSERFQEARQVVAWLTEQTWEDVCTPTGVPKAARAAYWEGRDAIARLRLARERQGG